MIHHFCPHCAGLIRSREQLAGFHRGCPHCKGSLLVPPTGIEGNLPAPPPGVGQFQGGAASAEGPSLGEAGASGGNTAPFLLWMLGGLLSVVGVGGLAWWLVATYPAAWKAAAWLGGGLAILFGLWGIQSHTTSAKKLGICGFVVWAYITWLVIGLMRSPTMVYVDNFSTHDVSLELEAEPWMVVKRGTKQEVWVQRKTYQLEVRSAGTGRMLDRRTITVDEQCPYILNVLGAGIYEKGRVEHGWGIFEKPERIRDIWIRADVDYLFKSPPFRISVPQGTKGATRTYLLRVDN